MILMELKVWCDGIQRVVCGVSSSTTCQDVVFALAHATAQTGRFILIEKWRNNERLLAPTDQPLAVLSKWGEYANDVTFVMKRSEAKNTLNAANHHNNSSLSNSPLGLSTTTTSPLSKKDSVSSMKKSSPHIFSSSDNSLRKWSQTSLLNGNSHSNSGVSGTAVVMTPTTASNASANASPTKSMSTSHLTSHNNQRKAETMNANATSTAKSKTYSQTIANSHSNDSNSTSKTTLLSSRPRHPPPYEEAISKSALITNNTASHTQLTQSLLEERNNKRRSLEPSPQTQKLRTNSQKELLSQRDAQRLSDMQKETKTPEKDKLTLEQQISSMERKLLENEIIIKRYKEEMTSIHQLWLEQESMITKLDQQKLEEELDSLVSEAKKYEEDVTDMKKKLSNCEGDIADCRQKIAKLMDKLEDSEKNAKIEEMERLEKEENDRLLAEQLKIAIRDKNREYEAQKSELQTLNNSMIQLDTIMQEKSTQLDKLINDMKDANIQGLALQPSEDASRFAKQSFHQRSGSTRRMVGSPRQLETAVATNKNPHGVWV